MPTIYNAPEDFGLELVWSGDKGDGNDFNIFLVLRSKSGNLYYDQDSGCSCPSPFEDSNLETLGLPKTLEDILHAATEWGASQTQIRELKDALGVR